MYSTIRTLAFPAWRWLGFRESLPHKLDLEHLRTQLHRRPDFWEWGWAAIAVHACSRFKHALSSKRDPEGGEQMSTARNFPRG